MKSLLLLGPKSSMFLFLGNTAPIFHWSICLQRCLALDWYQWPSILWCSIHQISSVELVWILSIFLDMNKDLKDWIWRFWINRWWSFVGITAWHFDDSFVNSRTVADIFSFIIVHWVFIFNNLSGVNGKS